MGEAEFLSGKSLADRVRLICREDRVDCAVAFLGRGMRDDLFPRWPGQEVRIICDLSMGCTSRAALEEFGAPDNDRLVYRDGLHGKVYLSGAGMVVGSPNLSRNGIGLSAGSPANLETGVFHVAGSAVWKAAKQWFEETFDSKRKVDERQLERVPPFAQDAGRRVDVLGKFAPSVLTRAGDYPSHFDGVIFLSSGENMTDEQEEEARNACARDQIKGLIAKTKRDVIWFDKASQVPEATAAVLYWHADKPTLNAYTDVVRVRVGRSAALLGQKGWSRFWRQRAMVPPDPKEALANDLGIAAALPCCEWAYTSDQLKGWLDQMMETRSV